MKSTSMASTKKEVTNRWSMRTRFALLGLAAPVLILCCCIAWYGIHEWRAASVVDARLQQIRSEGSPVDNDSLEAYFLKHASQVGTVAWSEIGAFCASAMGRDKLPIVGSGKIVNLSENPDVRAQVDDFLERMEPVVAKIHAASELPTPVYQPTAFQGHGTLLGALQQSQQIMNVTCLDADFAVQTGDTARALRDFQSMQGVAEAFNWDFFLVGKSIYLSHLAERWRAMARSLKADHWNAEELDELRNMVGPSPNTAASWRRSLDGERAMWIEHLSSAVENLDTATLAGDVPLLVFLWHGPYRTQVSLLDQLQLYREMASDDLAGFVKRGQELALRQNAIQGAPFQYYLSTQFLNSLPAHFLRIENDRRLLLTAIACKQFQLKFERWPEQLSELTQVGSKPSEWTTVDNGPLGYTRDGDSVKVWNALTEDTSRVLGFDAVPLAVFEDDGNAGTGWGIEVK